MVWVYNPDKSGAVYFFWQTFRAPRVNRRASLGSVKQNSFKPIGPSSLSKIIKKIIYFFAYLKPCKKPKIWQNLDGIIGANYFSDRSQI